MNSLVTIGRRRRRRGWVDSACMWHLALTVSLRDGARDIMAWRMAAGCWHDVGRGMMNSRERDE